MGSCALAQPGSTRTFLDNLPGYLDIATDAIRRCRTDPCIVVWCGATRRGLPPPSTRGLAAAVRAEHGEVDYVSNSAGGVVSEHGPYRWIDPPAMSGIAERQSIRSTLVAREVYQLIQ